jgi:hypothetical protein
VRLVLIIKVEAEASESIHLVGLGVHDGIDREPAQAAAPDTYCYCGWGPSKPSLLCLILSTHTLNSFVIIDFHFIVD